MSFWSKLIGGGVKEAGEGVKTALDGAGGFLKDIRIAITGKDPEMDAKVLAALEKVNEAQAAINAAEAASASFFVAGWRPALGWLCAISLGIYYIPRFILGMTMWSIQVVNTGQLLPMPEMGVGDILGLVFAMLGMSGIRAWEKKEGVAR